MTAEPRVAALCEGVIPEEGHLAKDSLKAGQLFREWIDSITEREEHGVQPFRPANERLLGG
jgi:hypothetical protein